MNDKNKDGGQRKDERPQERVWDAMQPNRKIGEKPGEMGRTLGKDGCRQTSKESRCGKISRTQEKPQLRWEDCVRRDMRRLGEDERWRQPIENYGKKEHKEWLDNIL